MKHFANVVSLVLASTWLVACSESDNSSSQNDSSVGGNSGTGSNSASGGATAANGVSTAVSGGSTATGESGGTSTGGSTSGTTVGSGGTTSATSTVTSSFTIVNGYATTADGAKGYLYTTTDAVGSTIAPTTFSAVSGNEFCVTGSTAAVTCSIPGDTTDASCQWSTYWGVGVGWSFNVGQAYDLSAFTGLGFTLTNNASSTVYAVFGLHDDTRFCAPLTSGTATLAWSDFTTSCDGTGASPTATDLVQAETLQFEVHTAIGAATPFDFCVSDILFTVS
jgi:hypothetical protein